MRAAGPAGPGRRGRAEALTDAPAVLARYKNVDGPFPDWEGPKGVKADGGGCTRGRGKVGGMVLHRAVNNKDVEGEGDLPPPEARVRRPSPDGRPALSSLTVPFAQASSRRSTRTAAT